MSEILRTQRIGDQTYVTFVATPKMRVFALAMFADPENRDKEPEEVLKQLGFSTTILKKWQAYDPYFSEFLEEMKILFSTKNRNKMLDAVGMEKALSGDFQFWKTMALKEKVIDPDNATLTIIPANLGGFSEWSEQQVLEHTNNLMDSLRGVENKGVIDVAPSHPSGGHEGNSRRASSLSEEPLEISYEVGADGEREREIGESV